MASKAQYIKRGEELIEIIPPAPTEQSRGGIIASPKTSTDTTEAKLGEDGKLYVNTSGASGISVSDVEPTDESSIWINPDTEESYTVPEINDETVSAEDTWSSEKINNQIEALNSKIGKTFSVGEQKEDAIHEIITNEYNDESFMFVLTCMNGTFNVTGSVASGYYTAVLVEVGIALRQYLITGTKADGVLSSVDVNSKTTWKLLGKYLGDNAVSLPNNYEELLIIAETDTTDNYSKFEFHIPKLVLNESPASYQVFKHGSYATSAYNIEIIVYAHLTSAYLKSVTVNGNARTSTCSMRVYYR